MSRFKVMCNCGWELATNDREEMLDLTAAHDEKCPLTNPPSFDINHEEETPA